MTITIDFSQGVDKELARLSQVTRVTNDWDFDFSNNNFALLSETELAAFPRALTNIKYRTLDLSKANLGTCPHVLEILLFLKPQPLSPYPNWQLNRLNLADNQLGLWGVAKLVLLLEKWSFDCFIQLAGNDLGCLGSEFIEIAGVLSEVMHLDLSRNKLYLVNALNLTEAVAKLQATVSLFLDKNYLARSYTGSQLASVFKDLKALNLYLNWNDLHLWSVDEVAALLEGLPPLVQQVSLLGNWLPQRDADKIEALKKLFAKVSLHRKLVVEDFLEPAMDNPLSATVSSSAEEKADSFILWPKAQQCLHQFKRFLDAQEELDELTRSAYLFLAHASSQLGYMENNPQYLPHREFTIALDLSKALPQAHVLKQDLQTCLATLGQVLGQRDPMQAAAYNHSMLPFLAEEKVAKPFLPRPEPLIERSVLLDRLKQDIAPKYPILYSAVLQIMDNEALLEPIDAYPLLIALDDVNPETLKSQPFIKEKTLFLALQQVLVHFFLNNMDQALFNGVLEAYLIKNPLRTTAIKNILFTEKHCVDQSCGVHSQKSLALLYCLQNHLPLRELALLIEHTACRLPPEHKVQPRVTYHSYAHAVMFGSPILSTNLLRFNPKEVFSDYKIWFYSQGKQLNPQSMDNSLSVPLFLATQIGDDLQIKKDFISLLALYERINTQEEKTAIDVSLHQYNKDRLFLEQSSAVSQLIQLMGVHGIALMRKHLAYTVTPLKKLLTNLPILDVPLHQQLKACFFKAPYPQYYACFYDVLLCVDLLKLHSDMAADTEATEIYPISWLDSKKNIHINTRKREFIDTLLSRISNAANAEELLISLVSLLLQKIFGKEALALNTQECSNLFKKMPMADLVSLLVASQQMKNDHYKEVFYGLLKRDLGLVPDSVYDFLQDQFQDDEVGRSIAKHNQTKIIAPLRAAGIDPKSALEYKETYTFSVRVGQEKEDSSKAYLRLWDYLQKLRAAVEICQEEPKFATQSAVFFNTIASLFQELDQLQANQPENKNELESEPVMALASLQANLCIRQILKKVKQFNAAARDHIKQAADSSHDLFTMLRSLVEFSGHVHQQKERIKNQLKHPRQSEEIHTFTVQQTAKGDPRFYTKGEEVNCCLSPNGGQFPALNQRRMDLGMLIHEAIDHKTQKTAALIWLYFSNTGEGIDLKANFFEVHARYGTKPAVRLALLHGLLEFTNHYLKKHPNIKGFYMNELDYGLNKGDLESYPVVPVGKFDKLGGAYQPSCMDEDDYLETQKQYYLVSLEKNRFHQFSSKILERTRPSSFIPPVEELALPSEASQPSESLATSSVPQRFFPSPPQEASPTRASSQVLESRANKEASIAGQGLKIVW